MSRCAEAPVLSAGGRARRVFAGRRPEWSRFVPTFLFALALPLYASAVEPGDRKAAAVVGDAEKWKEMQGGEPVLLAAAQESGGGEKEVVAGILIAAPAKTVWDILTDVKAATKYVASLKRAEIVERGVEGGSAFEVVDQDWKFGRFPVTFTYRTKRLLEPYRRIRFARISGDLDEIEGAWEFFPAADGRTLLVYRLRVKPGMLIPEAVVRRSLRKSLPESLAAVREEVARLKRKADPGQRN